MREPSHEADTGLLTPDAGLQGPERRCVLTGRHGARDRLIRLVPGPDGAVWPDLGAKLPGRGAWVLADAALLAAATGDGRLKKALARAWRGKPPAIPADLAARIDAGLTQRALNRLGLEMRAGHLVWGSDRIGEWARAGRLVALLHAADAAADGARRLDQAFRVGGGDAARIIWLPADRLALSSALGRDNMVHIGIADAGAAGRIETDVARWKAFVCTTGTDGTGAGDAPEQTGGATGTQAGAGGVTGVTIAHGRRQGCDGSGGRAGR